MSRERAAARASEPARAIRVFVVDDHALIRLGLRARFEAEPNLLAVGDCGTVRAALPAVREARPDVVVVDISLRDGDGLDLIGAIREELPDARFVVLSGSDDEASLHRSIVAGASAYVQKGDDLDRLVEIIVEVGRGESHVGSMLDRYAERRSERALDDHGRLASLTQQERAVLRFVADGLTNREISERLFVAEKTVRNHVSNVLHKLGLRNRTEAALFVSDLARA